MQSTDAGKAFLDNEKLNSLLMRLGYLASIELTDNEPESTVFYKYYK